MASTAAASARTAPATIGAGRATLILALCYAIYAILLNSVGTVILQSIISFHVEKLTASTLEAFKDLTIALTSFTLAAQVPRMGLKTAILASLALAAAGCVLAAVAQQFWAMRALFFCIGVGFALMKVAVYTAIGQFTASASSHARMLGIVESLFMVAVVASAWIFAAFIDPAHPAGLGWLQVYWWLAGGCAAVALVVMPHRFAPAAPGDSAAAASFGAMIGLLGRRAIQIFIGGVFLYVFVEQGLGTWLPSINHLVLGLNEAMAVQAASAFALSIAAGRMVAGLVVERIGWRALLLTCLGAMAAILLAVPPLTHGLGPHPAMAHWADVPLAAILLPATGFFMAPIYPTLNSVVLNTVSKDRQAGLIGLIVVFSALGGTTGSRIVAALFSAIPDAAVLYSLLPPIALIALVVVALGRWAER